MDFEVRSEAYAPESRGWLRGPHGTEPGTTPSITLDLSLFTKADHYPEGFIKSGIVLGKVTATGLYGPYKSDLTDGRQTAKGLAFNSVSVRDGQTKALNALVVHAFVEPSRLPYSGAIAGALDNAARTALSLIYWD